MITEKARYEARHIAPNVQGLEVVRLLSTELSVKY